MMPETIQTSLPPAAAADPGGAGPVPRAADGRLRRWVRLTLGLLALLLALLVLGVTLIDFGVSVVTRGAIVDRIEAVEPIPVALILGTARTHQGRPNQYYQARIQSAAALYHSGRVRGILVSGDNATIYYNEPVAMQRDLIAAGVPAEYITLDYAGFRTLDSMVRAKEVFGLDRLVVVTQRFHAERAIFLGRRFGIDARGLAAPDPTVVGFMRVRAREVLARVAAVLDLVTGRGPRFLGEPETVRLRQAGSSQRPA
ncbi:MAG: hypothetical protein EA400_08820 [Chromatiaceae bacterium]|nr:MAG: hypothetical protein EA400_08820 [Chromatiaceae bacterium]